MTTHRVVHMTRTCFKIRTVCYPQHDHFFFICTQLFLALTVVTVVVLTDASVKVVLYKRCTFCPVFFALSTTEEASHSWGETYGRSEASKAGVWETIGRIMTQPESLKNYILRFAVGGIFEHKLFFVCWYAHQSTCHKCSPYHEEAERSISKQKSPGNITEKKLKVGKNRLDLLLRADRNDLRPAKQCSCR